MKGERVPLVTVILLISKSEVGSLEVKVKFRYVSPLSSPSETAEPPEPTAVIVIIGAIFIKVNPLKTVSILIFVRGTGGIGVGTG